MSREPVPAVWFPAVYTGAGTDISTKRLAEELRDRGVLTEITWLPLRAEFAPWTVPIPKPPAWANVVHINTWLPPRFLPKGLPIVASLRHSVHHPDLDRYKGLVRRSYHRYWIRPFERMVLRRADVVVAVSRFAADTGRNALLDCSMQIVYNGINIDQYRPGYQQGRPRRVFRLLYVGSWMKRKGVDLLAPIMRELGDGFELCYTGGDPARRDKRGMPANMHDIGRLNGDRAVIAAMQNADAFLFPSRSEGFGLVAAEAMACGLPVIATRGSSLVEVVEDGVDGILCEPDDLCAFVSAARTLADNSTLRNRMSVSARDRAVHVFAIDRMIDAYLRIYKDMLER